MTRARGQTGESTADCAPSHARGRSTGRLRSHRRGRAPRRSPARSCVRGPSAGSSRRVGRDVSDAEASEMPFGRGSPGCPDADCPRCLAACRRGPRLGLRILDQGGAVEGDRPEALARGDVVPVGEPVGQLLDALLAVGDLASPGRPSRGRPSPWPAFSSAIRLGSSGAFWKGSSGMVSGAFGVGRSGSAGSGWGRTRR